MKAMILAAGRGERMRPLTDTTPKPLIKIDQYCLIEHHIIKLQQAGITDIIINTAWLAEKIHEYLGDGSRFAVNIHYSNEGYALETGGGIKKALPLLGDDFFLVVNGDVWSDIDYQVITPLANKTQMAHLILVNNPNHNQQGDFSIHDQYLNNNRESRLTYSGIGLYHRDLFKSMKEQRFALGPLLREAADKQLITAEHYAGYWLDVGTTERLAELKQHLG